MLKYCDARALIPTNSKVTLACFGANITELLPFPSKEANIQSVRRVFKRRNVKPTSETEVWRAKLR